MSKPQQTCVVFKPNGEVQFTLREDHFMPELGTKRSIERMTSITFDEPTQKFVIEFVTGALKGLRYTDRLAKAFRIFKDSRHPDRVRVFLRVAHNLCDNSRCGPVFFDTYADAVNAELRFVDELRLFGVPVV